MLTWLWNRLIFCTIFNQHWYVDKSSREWWEPLDFHCLYCNRKPDHPERTI